MRGVFRGSRSCIGRHNPGPELCRESARLQHAGFERIRSLDFEVVGNLDSDLSFDAGYLAFLMQKFSEDPKLGVAGTPFIENGYDSARDSFEGENHVAGGCQLFRRKCWDDVGGYLPNRAGGIDWVAVTTARMNGWTTRSFQEKRFHHYRPLGTAQRGVLASLFSYGEKDYYLGNSPVWEIFRVIYRMAKPPRLLGGLSVLAGFFVGDPAAHGPGCLARTDALSSRRADEKTQGHFGRAFPPQEGGQLPFGN